VLIVGAGLSGIGAACHLKKRCPHASVAIVEARDAIGGTWDLFRYPGVRSDSDMFTLGYSFRPWHSDNAISDGQTILDYIRDTARAYGIDRTIRFGQKVVAADWDSAARAGRCASSAAAAARPTRSSIRAASSTCAAAITTTTAATCPTGPAWNRSEAGSCIRSNGRRTCRTRTGAWW
jgi:phytoene dehydrogenase-like protein